LGREGVAQGRSGGDAELREDPMQVAAYGPVRQEQSLPYRERRKAITPRPLAIPLGTNASV
jgi:hypothetical protein